MSGRRARVVVSAEGEVHWDAASLARLAPSRAHALVPGAPSGDVVALALETARALAASERGALGHHAPRVAALRSALTAAPEDAYRAARDAVGALAVEPEHARLALAGAFTGEPDAIHAAIRAHLARAARPAALTELIGPFATDAALSEALAVATAAAPRALYPHALDVVAHLGPAAVGPLRAMLLCRYSDSSMDVVARALGLIATDAAGHVLLPLAAVRRLRPRARRWALAHPARAAAILASLIEAPTDEALDLAERADIASSLEALLAELTPRPRGAATRGGWPPGAPRALRDAPLARPGFLVAARLPRLALDDGAALPADAILRLASLLAAGDARAIAEVRLACDRERLADAALAIFEQWVAHGADPRARWPIEALGALATDRQLPALVPYLGEWQRAGATVRAGRLLDAIAAMGTEAALLELDRVARKDRYRRLRARAREAIAKAGAALGLDGDALEDRLAPALGLDAGGATTLELGGRTLAVAFDEALRPRLSEGGRPLARFPPLRAGDAPALHAAAKARFAALRAAAARVADQQVARLERMLITERAVPLRDFSTYFVAHPLVRHLVVRLLWTAHAADAAPRRFRVLEGAPYDADERPLALEPEARVALAHPLELAPAELARWAECFADDELAQPFAQLGRATYPISGEERATGRLHSVEAIERPWSALASLVRAGLFTRVTDDGLRYTRFEGAVAAGVEVRVYASPGLYVGDPYGSGAQRLVRVEVPTLAALSDVRRSEVVLALETLLA
ncbi:MAG: DUF4132 domain-containing protein [Sandaracinaceae bacterium]|nr:DUF4132 domain-containing protein [Sandaracinaceae bacterium]